MTLTHISEAIRQYAEGLADADKDLQCTTFGTLGRCQRPAEWDLIAACEEGHESVAHHCTEHKEMWLAPGTVDRLICVKHPEPIPARWAAVYPRRRS